VPDEQHRQPTVDESAGFREGSERWEKSNEVMMVVSCEPPKRLPGLGECSNVGNIARSANPHSDSVARNDFLDHPRGSDTARPMPDIDSNAVTTPLRTGSCLLHSLYAIRTELCFGDSAG
jgi:hypothetical protein